MAEKRLGASLLAELRGESTSKAYVEFRTDVSEIIDTYSGYELVDAVIERVQRYAMEEYERLIELGVDERNPDLIDGFRSRITIELSVRLSHFITDAHREFVVCAHARGLTTSAAVLELIDEDEAMNRLVDRDALGRMELQRLLGSPDGVFETGDGAVAREKVRRGLARSTGSV